MKQLLPLATLTTAIALAGCNATAPSKPTIYANGTAPDSASIFDIKEGETAYTTIPRSSKGLDSIGPDSGQNLRFPGAYTLQTINGTEVETFNLPLFKCYGHDCRRGDGSGRIVSEGKFGQPAKDMWYSIEMRIDQDLKTGFWLPKGNLIFTEFKDPNNPSDCPLVQIATHTEDRRDVLTVAYKTGGRGDKISGGDCLYSTIPKGAHFEKVKPVATMREMRGKWLRIEQHIIWSRDPEKGLVETYVNGQLREVFKGNTCGGSSCSKVYRKHGVYFWSQKPDAGRKYPDGISVQYRNMATAYERSDLPTSPEYRPLKYPVPVNQKKSLH